MKKTVNLTVNTWERLIKIKYSNKKKTLDQTIDMLLTEHEARNGVL